MFSIRDLFARLKMRPSHSKDPEALPLDEQTRFVILSWKGAGSEFLSEILHQHAEITMHGQVFDPNEIATYHPEAFRSPTNREEPLTVQERDLDLRAMVHFALSGMKHDYSGLINPNSKAAGFVSFPEHWATESKKHIFLHNILYWSKVKKIVLYREDELALFVSQKQGERGLSDTITVDPAEFQTFLSSYRDTFQRQYQSPHGSVDTFLVSYEQLMDEKKFKTETLVKIWDFLGVSQRTISADCWKDLTKPADRDLSLVIDNYKELEFCFRRSNVLHFANKQKIGQDQSSILGEPSLEIDTSSCVGSWTFLLPICSRPQKVSKNSKDYTVYVGTYHVDLPKLNRSEEEYWSMLEDFAESLRETSSKDMLQRSECIVGINVDDPVFQSESSRERIRCLLPCHTNFVDIQPAMYGKVCNIWNALAQKASNDFVVPFGDDVKLLAPGWQQCIEQKFHCISKSQNLPFGAACVAFKDVSYPGQPTIPVIHRWHLKHFGSILPEEFVDSGGGPYLYELYSRFNAAAVELSCLLVNRVGGLEDARHDKTDIDWKGEILERNILHLANVSKTRPTGICLDVVVPSYRVDNDDFLRRLALLRATTNAYIKFWFVVDNPKQDHVDSVKKMADEINHLQSKVDGNYFINVVHYGTNRGGIYARKLVYNISTADWMLCLDDDVIPDKDILDSFIGAIKRYPEGKVFLGPTELPKACNLWTEMICAGEACYFWRIAEYREHPPWGPTANIMFCGCRYNPSTQFKPIFYRAGGGEEIDLVFQFKEYYKSIGHRAVVGVPEARVKHPWWGDGKVCYRRFYAWGWGNSFLINEWKQFTFLTYPNWIEYTAFVLPPLVLYSGNLYAGITASLGIVLLEHAVAAKKYFANAKKECGGGLLRSMLVALGAASIHSVQDVARAASVVCRGSLYSLCRRFDFLGGQEPSYNQYLQRRSRYYLGLFAAITWASFRVWTPKNKKAI